MEDEVITKHIEGISAYPHKRKRKDSKKLEFNLEICKLFFDLSIYWASFIDFCWDPLVLVIDGYLLGTSNALKKSCRLKLSNLNIVSDSTKFNVLKEKNISNVYSGKLNDFLTSTTHVYDMMVLDIMGSWSKEMQDSIRYIFKNNRLFDVSILIITISQRKKIKGKKFMGKICYITIEDIRNISKEYGYNVRLVKKQRYDGMCSLFFKVIHPKRSMDYENGISLNELGESADDWFHK